MTSLVYSKTVNSAALAGSAPIRIGGRPLYREKTPVPCRKRKSSRHVDLKNSLYTHLLCAQS